MTLHGLADRILKILRTRGEFVAAAAVLFGLLIGVGCGPHPDILLPEATARIKGVVLDPQLVRVPAAKVQIEPRGSPPCVFDTFTRGDGTYEMQGICPGLYDIVVTKLVGTQTLRTRLRFVQLSAGQTALIPDLVLKSASTVGGRALLQGAVDHAGILVSLVGTDRSGLTNASGNVTITDVEEGTYAVNYQKSGYIEETITGVAVPANTAVALPQVVTLRPLNPATTGTIRGRVVLECRTDHSGIVVQVDGTGRNLVTTPGGFFNFDTLPLSTYSLTFRKRFFFDKTVGPVQMVPGSAPVVVPEVQLDSHRILNRTVQAFEIEHSPNGSQLARTTSANAAAGEIALTDPTAQIFHQVITSGAYATPFVGMSWSPDGKDILFVRAFTSPANTSAIGVVHSDGTDLRSLLPVANQFQFPSWSPDGGSFVYFRNPDIRTIRVDRSSGSIVATTSTSTVIDTINGVVTLTGLEWSATGRVYYSYNQNTATGLQSAGIFSVFATGGGRLQITPRTTSNQTISGPDTPTMRPDGAKIGFGWRYPPGANEPPNGIHVMDLDGVNATRLTTVPGINLDWSPDASRITFTKPPTDPQYPNRICEVLIPQ